MSHAIKDNTNTMNCVIWIIAFLGLMLVVLGGLWFYIIWVSQAWPTGLPFLMIAAGFVLLILALVMFVLHRKNRSHE